MTNKRSRVVILGGGFAGLMTAHGLGKSRFAREHCEVTIVDVSASHVYTPWLYEVATAGLASLDETTRQAVESSVNLEFSQLPNFRHVRFVEKKVKGVNAESRHVLLEGDRHLPYDVLLVALGAEPNYFGIPGLPENAYTLKTASDAHRIRTAVASLVRQAKAEDPKQIVVAGGGPNGIEFVAELANSLRTLEHTGRLARGAVRVTLIDAAKETNGILPEPLRSKANRRLRQLGIKLVTGVRVSQVQKSEVHGFTETGKTTDMVQFPADLVIWSGGVKVRALVKDLPVVKDAKGRIVVERSFAVPGHPGVFAAGDCAAQKNPYTQQPDPQSAQVAHAQAHVVAKNIIRLLQGRPLSTMSFPRRWHFLCALGGQSAAGILFGVRVWGYHAYLARRLTDLRYLVSLLPFFTALRIWLRAISVFGLNDK